MNAVAHEPDALQRALRHASPFLREHVGAPLANPTQSLPYDNIRQQKTIAALEEALARTRAQRLVLFAAFVLTAIVGYGGWYLYIRSLR